MKMIKNPFVVSLILAVVALMAVSLHSCAKKMPSGKLVSYRFTRGGGMNRFDITVYHLRYEEKTNKPLLTVSGPCEGELITVEVGEEAFDKCLELINKHKLYRSKGFYKPMMEVLDAPSSSFHLFFRDPYESIDGSGDMPDWIWDGLREIHTYLISLVGDRKPEGHVDRLYEINDIAGMKWTDGIVTVETKGTSTDELKQVLRQLSDPEDKTESPGEMGFERFKDGDEHYIVVYDYKYDLCRLFYSCNDKNKADAFLKNTTGKKTIDLVNDRFLCYPMIKALSDEQVALALDSIRMIEYDDYGIDKYTDIGEVNRHLLLSEQKYRQHK